MVYYIPEGDIFKISQVRNYAHGCNCAGAMGKGIAVQFRDRFPKMYEQYRNLCKNNKFTVGDVFKYSYKDGVVFNLGTQRTWKEKAEIEYVWKSLKKMMGMAVDDGVAEIAMPAIGAGLGGGNWSEIKKLIDNIASCHPSVDLYVVESYYDTETSIRYIKKEWEEENTLYYFHFVGEEAVRQIEIQPDKTIYLSMKHPIWGDSFLCDQGLKSLDLSPADYITKEEFERVWEKGFRIMGKYKYHPAY